MLLDCDPGHDDVLALLVAARHADLVGVTTVAGNAPLEQTTRNALLVCELAGIDVPVHRGATRPVVAPPRH
ncbi:MAG: ribonucleoside hydrolase, partial [Acidimicrobiia bacterium]|nr:ribonucleoside hydrolase [Acidimicrobiia bacterium]